MCFAMCDLRQRRTCPGTPALRATVGDHRQGRGQRATKAADDLGHVVGEPGVAALGLRPQKVY